MSATDKQKELTAELMNVLQRFHEVNPDLFVERIVIHSAQYMTEAKVVTGLSLTITVQPHIEQSAEK